MIYDEKQVQVQTLHNAAAFSGKDILEIGCGNGLISILLARGAGRYTAIDPDEEKIRQANETLALTGDSGPGPEFGTGSGHDLVFDDHSFDLVLFTLSLHHQEGAKALAEAFRVLKDGGRALVLEPSVLGEFQQCFHLFHDETAALEQAKHALEQSRFSRVKTARFSVAAAFEDLADIYAYYFTRERGILDTPENREKILNLLADFGKDPVSGPFVLEDILDFYVLEKNRGAAPDA